MQLETDVAQGYWTHRRNTGELTPSSEARYRRVFSSYVRFAAAHEQCSLAAVDARIVAAFVHAVGREGLPPATATSRFRLVVVRDAYAGLVAAGLCSSNPTAGLAVGQRPQARNPAPLSPAEVVRLRASGRVSPRDRLRPACVELALSGGTHLEVAAAVASDLDPNSNAVRLGGRWVEIDPFAYTTLASRVAACRRASRCRHSIWDPTTSPLAMRRPLATYPETSIAPGISSSLSRALAAGGVSRAGLRPASLREYAANRVYALAGIEAVANHLGLESLDVARGFIDQEWQAAYGKEVLQSG